MNDREVFRIAYEDRDDAACIAEDRVRKLEEAIKSHKDRKQAPLTTDQIDSSDEILWSLLNKN